MTPEDLDKLRKANTLAQEALDSDDLDHAIEALNEINRLLDTIEP